MANLKLNNQIKNITYPFYIKGSDFKELSLKALAFKKWKDNKGNDLLNFINKHLNNEISYEQLSIKDIQKVISSIDFVRREPLKLLKDINDWLNVIKKVVLNCEKAITTPTDKIKNNLISFQLLKQREFIESKKQEQETRIEYANNLTSDMGLDIDQIQDEQVRAMEDVAKIEQELEKTTSKFRKEKLLIKDIEIIDINDDFLEKADKLELINLIKNYLTIDEKIVKNEIKDQWYSNKDINTIGVNGIKFKINKGEK